MKNSLFFLKTLLSVLLLLLASSAFSKENKSIETLLTNHEDGDLQALSELNVLASKKNPHALSTLGFIYEYGINVPKDEVKAMDYYQQACDLGGDYGCGNLWYFYQYGIVVDKNSSKADELLNKISKDDLYEDFIKEQMIELYNAKIKVQTDTEMQYPIVDYLDSYLTTSDQVMQDMFTRMGFSKQDTLHLAKLWAQKGSAELNYKVGHFYNFGYSSLNREEKDVEALKWFIKAADKGDATSQNILGRLYEKGDWGIKQDPIKAIEWYSRAAKLGDADARMNLGKIYYEGVITDVNYDEAFHLFSQSLKYSSDRASKNLSLMYYNGTGVSVDCEKSALYYENAGLGFDDTFTRSQYLQLCQTDKKQRESTDGELPKLTMKFVSLFSGEPNTGVKCELYFGIKNEKMIPVENLRVGIKVISTDNFSKEIYEHHQVISFKPFGFNSLDKLKKRKNSKEYEGSHLVPVYDERGCDRSKLQFQIESATALINGKKVDLLDKGVISIYQ